jgi:hypothetical protein
MALTSFGITETTGTHYDPRTDSVRKMPVDPVTIGLANWGFPNKTTYNSKITSGDVGFVTVNSVSNIVAFFGNYAYTSTDYSATNIASGTKTLLDNTTSDNNKSLLLIRLDNGSNTHWMLIRSGVFTSGALTSLKVNDPWNNPSDMVNVNLSSCGNYSSLSQGRRVGYVYKK